MTHTITAIKARQNLGELLSRVSIKHDEFIIERGGKPMAAVISVEKLEQLREAARRHLGQLLEKNWATSKGFSVTEADALADEAKHRARKKRRVSR
jgi:prevent-host-death family protein